LVPAPDSFAFEPWTGQFSPSGELLAVAVRPIGGGPTSRAGRRLALVQVQRGITRAVPGSRVPSGYTFVTWASSGRHVFLTGGPSRRARAIVTYRLGDRRARHLRVTVGAFYGAAAT
jgi:hypothetical protein